VCHHFQDDILRSRDDEPRVRIPQRAADRRFVEQRKLRLGLGGGDEHGVGSERLARADLALEFLPALLIAVAADLEPATFQEMIGLFVELAAERGCPVRQLVVRGVEDKVRRVRRRSNVGGNGPRFLEPDDVLHAEFGKEVRESGADDAADTDDHNICVRGEACFFRHDGSLSCYKQFCWYATRPHRSNG
jgi:hypothetical protein